MLVPGILLTNGHNYQVNGLGGLEEKLILLSLTFPSFIVEVRFVCIRSTHE